MRAVLFLLVDFQNNPLQTRFLSHILAEKFWCSKKYNAVVA